GTMTEICEHMKMLWPRIAQLFCRQCGQPVRKESPQIVWEALQHKIANGNAEHIITFELPLTDKLPLQESLALIAKQGYQRLLLNAKIIRLDELASESKQHLPALASLPVVQDRLRPSPVNRPRFIEACEHAYHFGKGCLTIWQIDPAGALVRSGSFSNRLHCAQCDIEYREPSPALFSFNNPLGACP